MKQNEEDAFLEGFEHAIKLVQQAHPKKCEEPCNVCELLDEFGCDCPACTAECDTGPVN